MERWALIGKTTDGLKVEKSSNGRMVRIFQTVGEWEPVVDFVSIFTDKELDQLIKLLTKAKTAKAKSQLKETN